MAEINGGDPITTETHLEPILQVEILGFGLLPRFSAENFETWFEKILESYEPARWASRIFAIILVGWTNSTYYAMKKTVKPIYFFSATNKGAFWGPFITISPTSDLV